MSAAGEVSDKKRGLSTEGRESGARLPASPEVQNLGLLPRSPLREAKNVVLRRGPVFSRLMAVAESMRTFATR